MVFLVVLCMSLQQRTTFGCWDPAARLRRATQSRQALTRIASRAASVSSMSIADVKTQMLQIAALTDRGQRLNQLIAPMYQDKLELMSRLIKDLATKPCTINEEL